MSAIEGPNIVSTGLIFNYDMYNSRSWQGMPLTNQFAVPTPDSNNDVVFAVNGTGIFKRVYSGTFGGYTITSADVVYRYDLGVGGCHYHGNATSIGAGLIPTFRFDFYISPDATNYPTDSLLANFENYGGGAVGGGTIVPNNSKGIWQTVTFSGSTTSASGTQAMFLYPGGCSGQALASSGFILYKNPQVIFSATNGLVAPFVGPTGVRSTTQALLDLTQNRTITCNSLTYATNNTFSFNGTSDNIRLTNTTLGNGNLPWTVSAWVKTTTTVNALGQGSVLSNASGGPVYSMMGVNAGKIVYWTYQNSAWAQKLGVRTVNDNNWHLLTWVNNSNNTMAMYVDGTLDSNVADSTSGNNNPVDIIGASWAAYFAGSIPSLSIYNVALTADQVAQNFIAQRSFYGV